MIEAVVACAGMGAERATLAVQAAMSIEAGDDVDCRWVWRGPAIRALRVGEIVRAGVVVDTQTGERFS